MSLKRTELPLIPVLINKTNKEIHSEDLMKKGARTSLMIGVKQEDRFREFLQLDIYVGCLEGFDSKITMKNGVPTVSLYVQGFSLPNLGDLIPYLMEETNGSNQETK